MPALGTYVSRTNLAHGQLAAWLVLPVSVGSTGALLAEVAAHVRTLNALASIPGVLGMVRGSKGSKVRQCWRTGAHTVHIRSWYGGCGKSWHGRRGLLSGLWWVP